MTSNAFTNADISGINSRTYSDDLRGDDADGGHRDAPGLGVDERNLQEDLMDYDLESGLDGGRSRITLDGLSDTAPGIRPAASYGGSGRGRNRSRWHPRNEDDEGANDVPASLL